MSKRPLNRRNLRAEADAVAARGIPLGPSRPSRAKSDAPTLRPKPAASPRMKIVWAVCDLGGRTIATFEYAEKAAAEAKIADLKARNKGNHFLRSVKEPIPHSGTSSPD
ncbi:MAG: hypothetical protein P4L85_18230 [Paludisphaera borealis]|uniref:hypothetical protein n=1 Tax=Paludisphaera borealis TaxID=1387353 RepID=UPI00284E8D83|nr:hypothetical protein [Paludisphaera borealis]MDR3621296.1 hypothetical protein [Paludisphaera borealis]